MLDRTISNTWPTPKSRGIGFYSDSLIYLDVLSYGIQVEYFTKSDLINLLSNRVKGLVYTKAISTTAINNLIKELLAFRWIEYYLKKNINAIDARYLTADSEIYSVPVESRVLLESFQKDKSVFYDTILRQLYGIYTIPGWFIQRLWDINPRGQGQVIIPSPPKSWNPISRPWNDNSWSKDLTETVHQSYEIIHRLIPSAFPVELDDWLKVIRERWEKIGNAKPRKGLLTDKDNNEFTPRKRLAMAMRESVVKMLFKNENPVNHRNDFEGQLDPLLPRTYSYWCSRLEEVGLINYTDYNINIPGRIIYPLATFYPKSNANRYSPIPTIKNLEGRPLHIFRPSVKDSAVKELFLQTLFEEYNKIYRRTRSLYISSQDLRDEVCRVMKLSSLLFDSFLEQTVNESIEGAIKFRISLETDVREDQQSRTQMLRKPVYYNKRIISLIAITYA